VKVFNNFDFLCLSTCEHYCVGPERKQNGFLLSGVLVMGLSQVLIVNTKHWWRVLSVFMLFNSALFF